MNMRRSERQVTDPAAIREILSRCKICHLAMTDQAGPYLIPLSPGPVWDREGRLTLYFHCAKEGRKLEAIRLNPQVAFELDTDFRLTGTPDLPCSYSCDYACITGTGRALVVEDPAEKQAALEAILFHQTARRFPVTPGMAESVTILAVRAESLSAKVHRSQAPTAQPGDQCP